MIGRLATRLVLRVVLLLTYYPVQCAIGVLAAIRAPNNRLRCARMDMAEARRDWRTAWRMV